MAEYKIQTLSSKEIQELQVDQALRIIGTNSQALIEVNNLIGQAIVKKSKADMELQQLKNDKSVIVEINRALKVMCNNG